MTGSKIERSNAIVVENSNPIFRICPTPTPIAKGDKNTMKVGPTQASGCVQQYTWATGIPMTPAIAMHDTNNNGILVFGQKTPTNTPYAASDIGFSMFVV